MATDIAGNLSTTATLEVGQSLYGSLETIGDHDWFRMELGVGEYQVRLHGVGLSELNDPFLELRDASGNSLGFVDDYQNGWGGPNVSDPYATLTIVSAGTFYLDISSFVEGTTADDTGDYLLTLAPFGDGSLVHTLDEIAWQLTTNFQEFFGYDGGYAFDVGVDDTLTVNVTALTEEAQALALAALQVWTDVTGIAFDTVAGAAEINFDDSDAGVNAYASPNVSGSTIISSDVMITSGWLNEFGTGFDSYSFETYIHEIGHALGLGHGGNYNGSIDDPYYANDSLVYSIMSYLQVDNDEFTVGGDGNNPTIDASFRYMQTVAMADIIAIQHLYGDETSTRLGNTTYGFNSNTGNEALDLAVTYGADMFMCVYDDGGVDTLNFSGGTVSQRINLAAESFSDVLGGRMNLSIARGVLIENAAGGSAGDEVVGNAASNNLYGLAGADALYGSDGSDHLYGGAGADRLYGGGGLDYARYDDAVHGNLYISLLNPGFNTGAAAGDRYVNIEGLVGGKGADTIVGDGASNYLYGQSGSDHIYGGLGADLIDGGAGIDYARYDDANHGDLFISLANPGSNTGAAAGDTYVNVEGAVGGAGNDSIVGDGAVNYLYGQGGSDNLYGGAGGDRLDGGAGIDYARYDDANYGNLVISLANPGANTGAAAGDIYVGVEGVVGGAGHDSIVGDGAANYLYGLKGNDTVAGGLGADFIDLGSGGLDVVRFDTALGAGNIDTVLRFVAADDTIALSRSIFTVFATTGSLAVIGAGAFNTGAAATQADDRIIYDNVSGALIYDVNGSNAGGATQFATLSAGLGLTAADFLIVA